MRAVARILARQRRGGGQEAGVASHHHGAIDARQRRIVEIGAGEGLGDEARRRREARHVVEADEIVVDGLGDMDRAQRMAGLLAPPRRRCGRCRTNRCRRCSMNVSIACALQDLEDLLAIFQVRLVAGRAERRGRGRRDRLEIVDGLLPEVDEVVVDDAAHAVQRAVDVRDAGKAPRLERHADQRLVDDRRRAAALGDENLVRHGCSLRCERARRTGRPALCHWL